MADIGFIGTGTIGAPVARRLIDAGHALHVFDIDEQACAPLVASGAVKVMRVADVASECATVFLSLPGPQQIEAVLLGGDGILNTQGALKTIVDLSTNSIEVNRRIAKLAAAQSIDYLDAPVSGGKVAAVNGTLTVMIGGAASAFETVRPLLETFGQHLFHLGPSSSGTLAKLVNNQIFLASCVLVQEGFLLGAKAGMDPATLLEVLKVSSAAGVVSSAPMLLSRRFNRDVFALSIAAKDIEVALESAASLATPMPMTEAAADVYRAALAAGLGGEDFYATVKILEAKAGVEIPAMKNKREK